MAQDYEVIQFKKGDWQDPNGNYWCDMALKGIGEPVRIVVKDPSQFSDGMTLYGRIEEMTSKNGKPYNRFYREKKDDQPSETLQAPQHRGDDQYWEDKNSAIKAQWAIGQAVQFWNSTPDEKIGSNSSIDFIENYAKHFYAMVDRVKGSSESTDPKAIQTETTSEASMPSGYEKAKEAHQTLKAKQVDTPHVPSDAELESLEKAVAGERFNTDDIPF